MNSLSLAFPLGVVFVVALLLLLYRFTPLNAKQSAFVVALLSIAAYMPFALLQWPGGDIVAIHLAVYSVVAYVLGIILSAREATKARAGGTGKWFHWGPALIVAFFAVIVIMDSIFVTLSVQGLPDALQQRLLPKPEDGQVAESVFPGVVHQNFYQREASYNQYLADVKAQQRRGWKVHKGWLADRPVAGKSALFQVTVEDREGKLITGAEVSGRFIRLSDSRLDQPFVMDEVSPGIYRSGMVLSRPGTWDLHLQIRKGDATQEVHASTVVYDTSGNGGVARQVD